MSAKRLILHATTVVMMLGLGACGGGGGGGGGASQPSGSTIVVGPANYVTVAQATSSALSGANPNGMMIPMSVGPTGPGRLVSLWLQNKRVARASTGRVSAQATYGPYQYQCAISGSISESDADNDEDLVPSLGDSITLVFNNCQDVAGETSNGTMAMTFTKLSSTPVPSGSAQVTFTQMSYVTARHSMTYSGSVQYDYENPSASVETLRTTVTGALTFVVSTHTGFNDTVTLLDGFAEEASYDSSSGSTVSTSKGLLQSAAAGGVVQVSSVAGAPITEYDTDPNPRSGAIQVRGVNSTLLMTVVSTSTVRLDLDADGNGSFESSSTMAWDDLL